MHIFLLNTWQLALQLVGLLVLADIEFGSESTNGGGEAADATSTSGGGVIIEKAEERGEVAIWETGKEIYVVGMM